MEESLEKNSFVFFESFYQSIKLLDENIQLELYKAICEYSLYGTEPELSPIAKSIFIAIKPNMDNAKKRYVASVENGRKGGAPKGNKNAKKQPKNNLKTTQKQPKNNLYVDVDVDEDVDEDEDVDVFLEKEKKEKETTPDPFFSPLIDFVLTEYQKVFNNKPRLLKEHRQRILDLAVDIDDFKETVPETMQKLKRVDFDLPNFRPNLYWLLKEDNYLKVYEGSYEHEEQTSTGYHIPTLEELENSLKERGNNNAVTRLFK